ncbi:MAG: hypothetical protein HRU50_04225 [Winogradskyella sp.]|uniref:hypothetical protein n=1 Tax=Winogradskyella sp. TaxID=1883156 RepID=UPI0025CD9E83|nr:hypothetical protein [Winogradskyella sp.]NRB59131.1 hypothetical protein [Winogradskyella sp.]
MISAQVLIIHFVELVAALSASYYWIKTKDQAIRPFVWYLWLIVFIETFGFYPYLYIHFDHPYIDWIEHSVIRRNTWLYNLKSIIDIFLIGLFILRNTNKKFVHRGVNLVVVSCTVFIISYYLISGNFFKTTIAYDSAIQTFAIFVMVILYYQELLKSEDFLEFYKSHVFYLLSGLLIFQICLTPISLFMGYYLKTNQNFVEFRKSFFTISNVLLYSCYTFAFFYSLHHKKQLQMRKSH